MALTGHEQQKPKKGSQNVAVLSLPWAELPAPGSGTGEPGGEQSQEGNLKVP